MKVKANIQDARAPSVPRPDSGTLRYVGHDKHGEKVMTGKFSSNVAPKKSHYSKIHERHDWKCPVCGNVNREYLVNCFRCNAKERPF